MFKKYIFLVGAVAIGTALVVNELKKQFEPAKLELQINDTKEKHLMTLELGCYLEPFGYKDGILTLKLTNKSGYLMSYTNRFQLQKFSDGEWVDLYFIKEPKQDMEEFHSLNDLQEVFVDCDLSLCGNLEAGQYRILKDDLVCEFTLIERKK